jgi:hypothetical protein
MKILPLFASLLLTSSLIGAAPSKEVVMSCLKGEATSSKVIVRELDTTDIVIDDNYSKGYSATLFNDHGVYGSASKGENFALVYRNKMYSIESAIPILNTKDKAEPFSPTLAEWFVITEGNNKFFCVSSNFDGLGRSGKNQYIRFGYFLPLDHSKTMGRAKLYFAIADTSPIENKTGAEIADQ